MEQTAESGDVPDSGVRKSEQAIAVVMPEHETYVIHIWRNRAIRGHQWVARVECTANGQRVRFMDPDSLLRHFQQLLMPEPDISGGEEAAQRATEVSPVDISRELE